MLLSFLFLSKRKMKRGKRQSARESTATLVKEPAAQRSIDRCFWVTCIKKPAPWVPPFLECLKFGSTEQNKWGERWVFVSLRMRHDKASKEVGK